MNVVRHPRLPPIEYEWLQNEAGWSLPLELIGGVPVVVPPTGAAASWTQGELFWAIRRWQRSAHKGGLLLQHVLVRFTDDDWLAPSIAWWSTSRRPDVASGPMQRAPDLVIEVLSSRTWANAEGPKRRIYTAAAVREIWLVDPVRPRITVAWLGRRDEIFDHDAEASSSVLAGFAVAPATIAPQ